MTGDIPGRINSRTIVKSVKQIKKKRFRLWIPQYIALRLLQGRGRGIGRNQESLQLCDTLWLAWAARRYLQEREITRRYERFYHHTSDNKNPSTVDPADTSSQDLSIISRRRFISVLKPTFVVGYSHQRLCRNLPQSIDDTRREQYGRLATVLRNYPNKAWYLKAPEKYLFS